MELDDLVDHLLRVLTDPTGRVSASLFRADRSEAAQPGLYSWWADATARDLIARVLDAPMPELVYAGQAGATLWPSGTPSKATLASRIRGNHLNGNADSSTFRLTISAILLRSLGLEVAEPGRLAADSNRTVSQWIRQHLQVAIAPHPNRDTLTDVEAVILRHLDPPLNIDGRPTTPARQRLTHLRSLVTRPDK